MAAILVESALRATVIATLVAAILGASRVKSAAVRHGAWVAVIVTMLMLPALIMSELKAFLPVLPPSAPERAASMPLMAELTAVPPAAPRVPTVATAEGATASDAVIEHPSANWQMYLGGLYLVGLTILLFRLALGTFQVHKLLRTAFVRNGKLMHQRCSTPVTVGWLNPRVILPVDWSEWPDAKLNAILLHEQEHVRRRDPLTQWLALLNRAVFWFHPLAWWLERHLSGLAEEACDAVVLSGGHDPRDYSAYLVDLARSASRAGGRMPEAAMPMPGARLPQRIRHILDGVRTPQVSRLRLTCIGLLCVLATGTVATVSPVPTQPTPPLRQAPEPVADVQPALPAQSSSRQSLPVSAAPPTSVSRLPSRPQPPDAPASVQEAVLSSWSSPGEQFEIRSAGTITLSDDDRDVTRMSPVGSLQVFHTTVSGDSRRVELKGRSDGSVERHFWIGGSERPWEPEGRAWWSEVLPRVIRRSGLNAEQRVARILASQGPAGVIDEIGRLNTDSVRRRYLTALSTEARLDGQNRDAYFKTLASMESDAEHRRVLEAVVADPSDAAILIAALRSTHDMKSSVEIRRFLIAVATKHALEGPVREAYLEAMNRMPSKMERNSVLAALSIREQTR
jgi:beta-lactamase regulating signal transducer with metallopeptidase domain